MEGLESQSANGPAKMEGLKSQSANRPAKMEGPKSQSANGPAKMEGPKSQSANGPAKMEGLKSQSTNGPAKMEGLEPQSANGPAKMEGLEPQSANGPAKTEAGLESQSANGPARMEGPKSQSANGPAKMEGLKSQSANGPAKTEGLEFLSANGPAKTEGLEFLSANEPAKTEGLEPQSANGPAKTEGLEFLSANEPAKTEGLEPQSANGPARMEAGFEPQSGQTSSWRRVLKDGVCSAMFLVSSLACFVLFAVMFVHVTMAYVFYVLALMAQGAARHFQRVGTWACLRQYRPHSKHSDGADGIKIGESLATLGWRFSPRTDGCDLLHARMSPPTPRTCLKRCCRCCGGCCFDGGGNGCCDGETAGVFISLGSRTSMPTKSSATSEKICGHHGGLHDSKRGFKKNVDGCGGGGGGGDVGVTTSWAYSTKPDTHSTPTTSFATPTKICGHRVLCDYHNRVRNVFDGGGGGSSDCRCMDGSFRGGGFDGGGDGAVDDFCCRGGFYCRGNDVDKGVDAGVGDDGRGDGDAGEGAPLDYSSSSDTPVSLTSTRPAARKICVGRSVLCEIKNNVKSYFDHVPSVLTGLFLPEIEDIFQDRDYIEKDIIDSMKICIEDK